jgi:hypothetical protein
VNVATLSVKDFVVDIPKLQNENKERKKERQQSQIKPTYEVILQNNTDFVIHRKTATTDKNFVFLISQGTFYIQDNKTKDIDSPLNEQKIKMFFQPFYGKFDLLTEVQWCINDRLDIIIQKMSKILKVLQCKKCINIVYLLNHIKFMNGKKILIIILNFLSIVMINAKRPLLIK